MTQHYPFGCCAYMLTYHPRTKVAQRGVRCLNFGRAEGQPGYLLFDGQRVHVSPHCSMLPWAFPGLKRKAGGGLMIPEPVDDRRAPEIPSTSKSDAAEPPTVSNDEGIDGSGDGGVAPENDDATHDENAPRSDDDDDNEDDNDDGGGGGGNDQLISQRLTRNNRQPIRPYAEANAASRSLEAAAHRFDVNLTEPFMIYVGSGADRPNSLRAHAAKHGLAVVMVDKKVGGYEHDLTFGPVIDDLEMILRHSSCTGMFFSTPCGTWTALRYLRPGPPVLRRLASAANQWKDEVLGILRPDGTLPESVQRANTIAVNIARLGDVAAALDKDVAFESPVSRATGSQFAIVGREDHAEMFTHPALEELERTRNFQRLYFDQCAFGGDYEKTTQIIANSRLYRKLRPRFINRNCPGGHVHRTMHGDVGEDGVFVSEDAAAYPSEMNECIADAYSESADASYNQYGAPSNPNSPHSTPRPSQPQPKPPDAPKGNPKSDKPKPGNKRAEAQGAVLGDPIEDWQRWIANSALEDEGVGASAEAFNSAFFPHPMLHARAAVQTAPPSWFSRVMQWSGLDGQAFPLPAEEFAGDSPSYRDTLRGDDAPGWLESRRQEIRNLENHDAYTEVPESELPGWNGTSSTEVVNTLWVFKKKRGKDGEVTKYKARCVYDGRNQKAVAERAGKELNSYAPCGRPSTHKAQVAAAVFHKRRHRTFDVTGAYLKGKFNETEVVYARPPPGSRTFTIIKGQTVPVIWQLNVPLYGEVDAGFIWNRTATEQLVKKQKFNQSQHDPGYFWKNLSDGTRMDLLLYVDDAYVTDNHSKLADAELEAFGLAFADKDGTSGITVQEPDHFLGANIDIHSSTSVTISSRAYVRQMAARYLSKPLEEYPNYLTPCARDIVEAYDEARDKVNTLDDAAKATYASKCGAAIFAGPCSRFDTLYVLGMCARCLTFPTERMDRAIDRVIAYMAKTSDRGVNYIHNDPEHPTLDYEVYSDSDWCTAHSTTGTCHVVRGRVIHASSKRQQSISISSTEAEIMAASLAASEAIFTRSLLAEMGFDMSEPTVLWVDNMGAVEITKRRESLSRSRHIERRYLKILEWVAEGKIIVKYKNTKENRADMFTKPLENALFNEHAGAIMGW